MTHPPTGNRKRTRDEVKAPPRLLLSLSAVFVAIFIAAEPLLFDAPPGMQVFQAALVSGFYLLLIFGSGSGTD